MSDESTHEKHLIEPQPAGQPTIGPATVRQPASPAPPTCVPTMSPDLVHSPAVAALPDLLQSLVRRFPHLTWLTLFFWRLGERWGQ
ncbi:MAG: hypothetical protein M3347_18455, partial [Armatimonadota bacterium]|nr:hypothetical protein [Armatimonadota bacterium]